MKASRPRVRQRGFTLIELIVVIAIMMILVSISVPAYNRSIIRAREAALRQDLFTLRAVIDHYTEDKEKAPQSLDDLLNAGYLKQIPVDPFTRSNSTWQLQLDDALQSVDQQEPGINDVHSGSTQISSEGTPYNQW